MAKRPGDAFGLSLLDVLSNALGGTLLLMMIVAASIGIKGEGGQEISAEEGSGEFKTVTKFDKLPSNTPYLSLLVVQIRFWGSGSIKLYLDRISSDESCSIGSIVNDPSQWLVIRKGEREKGWSVILKAKTIHDLPEKISVIATCDDKLIFFGYKDKTDLNWKSQGDLQYEILLITENINKPPELKLTCEAYGNL